MPKVFQSTSLSRGKTGCKGTGTFASCFQSTSLSRGKTRSTSDCVRSYTFQSTSLSRGKTIPDVEFFVPVNLSIHFPLTREDVILHRDPLTAFLLSIHFPLTREDGFPLRSRRPLKSFQSTSLSRGKTGHSLHFLDNLDLSIHFPLTREDYFREMILLPQLLSIHFPLTREDSFAEPAALYTRLSIHFPLTREDKIASMFCI